ncbi:putative lipid II flippase FtsW [Nocardioides yefusunii]|uniref:Probable peptidoglycan glycosyltransferase FtsW n=1 Tax=Nocardioides yefusunii TaxID=2500546 RepID=A0ABW1QXF4_9ACTN|nr:putative lipid II flippase FtsW [Nocardioides yefusunii]
MAWAEPDRLRSRAANLTTSVREFLDRPLTTYHLLTGASALLLVLGLVMVASASSVYSFRFTGDSYGIVKRQLTWVLIAAPVAWAASRMKQAWLRRLAWVALIGSAVLLALVQVPSLGVEVNGNRNWLRLGPVQIQPSELAKLSMILWAADVYARKDPLLDRMSHLVVPVVPVAMAIIGLVLWGRDLGTAMVLFAILMAMLWVVGFPWKYFALGGAGLVAVGFLLASTSSERMERLTNFVDPMKDYHNTGWQPAHGLYALATGRWFGQGIGDSTQKWGDLPEAHTDFIFAVLGEELGLLGTLLVVSLFLTIAFAAIRLASNTDRLFVRYASFGIVAWLVGQMIINVGMVLALLPVIGIPLPLVSYGGSALMPSLVALGLLIGFARREPEAAAALAARRGPTVVSARSGSSPLDS